MVQNNGENVPLNILFTPASDSRSHREKNNSVMFLPEDVHRAQRRITITSKPLSAGHIINIGACACADDVWPAA